MAEVFKNSYFFRLPNEVLIRILSNIDDILSQLNFCEVYSCDYFLQNRNVVRSIDVQNKYIFQDLNELSRKINHENVTTLNVNGLYWIESLKLRWFISKLVNLETLYAIQSSLGLTQADVEVYMKMPIKKLGVSVIEAEYLGDSMLPSVETLYISIDNNYWSEDGPFQIENVFPNVKKIWIDLEEYPSPVLLSHAMSPDRKVKIYVQGYRLFPLDFEYKGLTIFYTDLTPDERCTVCYERFNVTEKLPTCKKIDSVDWQMLRKLRYKKPYGPIDARRLYLNGNKLEGIFFEELNFFHKKEGCDAGCRNPITEVLVSENSQRLRKLCIMMCLLRDGLNYIRRGIETLRLKVISDNLQQLEELEIFQCPKFNKANPSVIQELTFISRFENLQRLRIDIPIESDGSFLTEIFLKCKRLQVLKIFSSSHNEELDFNLCNSVHNATSLKDLVYENYGINLDRLLEHLASIKLQNFQRILLDCSEADNFSEEILKKFMEANPQLIFLYFAISDLTNAAQLLAQNIVKLYEKKHPAKAFFIEDKQAFEKSKCYPMLQVHFNEIMMTSRSSAALNPLEDFQFF